MDIKNKIRISLPSFLIEPKDVFHIVRRTITADENLEYHDHDYAEVFWIKEGSGIHYINGEKHNIEKGTLCLIRPQDTHTFVSTGNNTGLVVTNIAFYLESLKLFKDRYFPDSETFFWTKEKMPYMVQLNADQLNEISSLSDYILSKKRSYINLDIIILQIFRMLSESFEDMANDMPHWLALALEQYNSPQLFREGVPGFVALTNRTTDHVNKIIKQYLNQTLTETVTKIKMNYAAQRLTMTNVPIKTICYNCGFNAIGHFYKVFKKYNGMTPNEYRAINHKVF
ncbi:AraC family transcriptional regulator [Saccharicrinis fermentans]|uniref:Chb operon repressor n=1 Tax=Saccharicrinis fermentans DSM 9555 = JCM 21142 TaxID=869213 RepID=W7YAZ5_9BACT|nr:AraC family transcriptional regulator [Saccharicrinis fermentans]GAF01546.1 chb operon repressor [Saccharicrinis fermentans DSM 9555 = JCM 21142]